MRVISAESTDVFVGPPPLGPVRPRIAEQLCDAACRRTFRIWFRARRAALMWLAPDPGDPRHPDTPGGTSIHRH